MTKIQVFPFSLYCEFYESGGLMVEDVNGKDDVSTLVSNGAAAADRFRLRPRRAEYVHASNSGRSIVDSSLSRM